MGHSTTISDIKFFEANDYSLQFVSYCVYLNLQIAFTFLAAGIFSKVKTASGGWIAVMELYPGLALYRMLYEFSKYALQGTDTNAGGMKWKDLNDSTNGVKELLIIMVVEWFVLLFVAYYVDQVISSRSGVRKSPLFLLRKFQEQPSSSRNTGDESRDFVSKYALQGSDANAGGMKWKDLNDSSNGMKGLLIIMVVEWFVLLFVAYYVDQVISSRSGVRKSTLFLLRKFQEQPSSSGKTSLISDESRDFDQAEKADVARE